MTFSYCFATLQAWLLNQQNGDGAFGEQRTDGSKGNSSVLIGVFLVEK